jgi:hypothetical protein
VEYFYRFHTLRLGGPSLVSGEKNCQGQRLQFFVATTLVGKKCSEHWHQGRFRTKRSLVEVTVQVGRYSGRKITKSKQKFDPWCNLKYDQFGKIYPGP